MEQVYGKEDLGDLGKAYGGADGGGGGYGGGKGGGDGAQAPYGGGGDKGSNGYGDALQGGYGGGDKNPRCPKGKHEMTKRGYRVRHEPAIPSEPVDDEFISVEPVAEIRQWLWNLVCFGQE